MKKNLRGFALITSVLIISILIPLVIAYIARVTAEYRFTSKFYNSIAAFNLAEAGIERALWEINYNDSVFSGWSSSVDGGGNTTITSPASPAPSLATLAGQTIGEYTVTVYIPSAQNPVTITSTGFAPNKLSADEERTIILQCEKNYQFTRGIVGLNSVKFSGGAYSDSYDSSKGPYNSDITSPLYNAGQQSSVASNGSITLSGGSYIYGDANPGPDYPFNPPPSPTVVTGSYATLQAPLQLDPIPPAEISNARTSNNNAVIDPAILPPGTYDLDLSGGDALTLPQGTYYFTSIKLTGGSSIQVSGPVKIYVDGGEIDSSGGSFVNSGVPKNLLILSTGPEIELSGGTSFIGCIYAPTSNIKNSGGCTIYGAIVCGSNVDSGGAALHFDIDLLKISPNFGTYKITYWQEIKQ